MNVKKPSAKFSEKGENLKIALEGDWVIDNAQEMHDVLENIPAFTGRKVEVSGKNIEDFDSLGAWLLYLLFQRAEGRAKSIRGTGFSQNLEKLISRTGEVPAIRPVDKKDEGNPIVEGIYALGAVNYIMCTHYGQLFTFIGFVLVRAFKALRTPKKFRMTSLVYHLEEVGLKALGIIGLMSFLIGAVIVNQGAIQLRQFGAEIFAVDLLAVAQLREMGVLLAAILIAGRSGSAFTAQIGSMKVREEVDAMEVLGLNPVDVLVLPRMLALVLVMPLITFFSDIMGALGGALMAYAMLDVNFEAFWNRFREAITMTTFYAGLIKAPFFGALIAINGCFEGLTVGGSAESVGRNTTRSVVQSIFLVIVLDAFFAMFFSTIGW